MSKEKEIKWLYKELPLLIEKKVITEEGANRIINYYGAQSERKHSPLVFIITSVLGALLIGAGIILLFGYNWEYLSRTYRTIFSILPLLVAQLFYGYTFFKKRGSIAWVESTSAFLMLMLASSIALIGQTYNLGGTLKDFMLTWMILSIPLLYLMNSSLAAILYLVGISYWAMQVYSNSIAIWYWLLLAAAIPHLAINLTPERKSIRANLLGWTAALTLIFASGCVVDDLGSKVTIIVISLLCLLIYLIGKVVFKHGDSIWSRPFQTVAIFIITFYSLSLCYTWHLKYFNKVNEKTIMVNVILGIILISAIIALIVYNYRKKNGINYFIVAFPLLLLIGLALYNDNMEVLPVILFNLYTLSFGIFYIWWGIKTEQISFVNAGMFLVSVLLLERFFDRDISFIIKGSIFIIIGVCFLSVNLLLMKKLKSKNLDQYA